MSNMPEAVMKPDEMKSATELIGKVLEQLDRMRVKGQDRQRSAVRDRAGGLPAWLEPGMVGQATTALLAGNEGYKLEPFF